VCEEEELWLDLSDLSSGRVVVRFVVRFVRFVIWKSCGRQICHALSAALSVCCFVCAALSALLCLRCFVCAALSALLCLRCFVYAALSALSSLSAAAAENHPKVK